MSIHRLMALAFATLTTATSGPTPPRPASTVSTGLTLACVAVTARELRYRGAHAVACGTGLGEVRGFVLARSGRVLCTITGWIDLDTDCTTLTFCGTTRVSCS